MLTTLGFGRGCFRFLRWGPDHVCRSGRIKPRSGVWTWRPAMSDRLFRHVRHVDTGQGSLEVNHRRRAEIGTSGSCSKTGLETRSMYETRCFSILWLVNAIVSGTLCRDVEHAVSAGSDGERFNVLSLIGAPTLGARANTHACNDK